MRRDNGEPGNTLRVKVWALGLKVTKRKVGRGRAGGRERG